MSQYIKSKSKTGTKPRTGNRYIGAYAWIEYDGQPERAFVLQGYKIKNGKRVADMVVFNSQAAAKKAGWVAV